MCTYYILYTYMYVCIHIHIHIYVHIPPLKLPKNVVMLCEADVNVWSSSNIILLIYPINILSFPVISLHVDAYIRKI